MKKRSLITNARIYTMAGDLVANSMAVVNGQIVAVGNQLRHDEEFGKFARYDLKGHTIVPGFVDAHTHLYSFTLSLGMVPLESAKSYADCLRKIERFCKGKPRTAWIMGYGLSIDSWDDSVEPNRYDLDEATSGRPVFIFTKDMHSAWVNSRALELAGISSKTRSPRDGQIVKDSKGEPTGFLREHAAYGAVLERIPDPKHKDVDKLYRQTLDYAYSKGVTGVHSFDGIEGFDYFSYKAQQGKLGLRINYYPVARYLDTLERIDASFGDGNDWLRLAGVKIFADGALGSQTAYCFAKYKGSKDNYGIEVTSTAQMKKIIRRAGKMGFPCAIHAIGDRAVDSVLSAFEATANPPSGARHRIEHLQLMRRKDISRVLKQGVVASMQPTHCTSDIELVENYWGARGKNAYIFRTLLDKGVPMAFGSDVPIEPLDPIAGISAAVRRARPKSRHAFYPQERITALQAVHAFTAGAAVACGQSHCRGYLLPGYPADFVMLSQDIVRSAPLRILETKVLATVIDGVIKYDKSRIL